MDPNAKQKAREFFTAVWLQLEDCQSTFLSPSNLRTFGVEACQVDIADDETLQFEPCFFKPYPPGVLRNHPIDAAGNDYDIRRLQVIPTFQDALDRVQKSLPVPADPLDAAQKLLEERLEEYNFWGNYAHADAIHCYLEYTLHAAREGGPRGFTLQDLFGLWDSLPERHGDPIMLGTGRLYWKCEISRQARSPLPHLMCTITADVDATLADQDLTLHEMRAIIRMIAIRARGPRRNWRIYPFLLLSFMGKQHGRITQVVVEEGRIMLQYSKLWSFEVEDTAPVELFIRYILSQPIGLDTPSTSSSLRLDPVTGMPTI